MRQLTFSKRSIKDIRLISEYIEAKFSVRIKLRFLEKLQKNLDYITLNPENFPKSDYQNLRKCVVSKHTIIFYSVSSKQVHIVSVFDTRQNPKRVIKKN